MAVHNSEEAGMKYMVMGDGPDGHFLVKTTRKALGKKRVGQFVGRRISQHLDKQPFPHDDGPHYSVHKESDEWQMEASGPCHHCSGSGHEMGNPGKACLDCGGSGKSTEKNEDAIDENFTQAAAAAARAHKTEFEYPKGSGKMHPVKMSKGTAHEINDDYDRIRELAGLR
jgi:hypothetical protein